MKEIADRYSDGEITHLDGVSVDYDDWHFNVRASNTEPLLRLNLESLVSEEHMAEKRDEVLGLIRAVDARQSVCGTRESCSTFGLWTDEVGLAFTEASRR